MKKVGLYLCFVLAAWSSFSQTETLLNSGWMFRQKGTEKWHPANVPGTVHTDLYANKLIPDPFYADNEKKLQWIENEDWEYSCEFNCDKSTLSFTHNRLLFEGLDTYAKVYLNDSLIITSDNMFRAYGKNAKGMLREGKNNLRVVFESAVKKGKSLAAAVTYTLPGEERVFTRKAQYQYGWDFGPRFVTCGIWKNVKLVSWNNLYFSSVHYAYEHFSDSSVTLRFYIETDCDTSAKYTYRLSERLGKAIKTISSQTEIFLKYADLHQVDYTIKKPKLWWCNGLGDPHLYHFSLAIYEKDKKLAEKDVSIGLRKIELVTTPDTNKTGESFFFTLNTVPVFIKGANYVPADIFASQIKKENYAEIISMAKSCNMNMLRVWGGGFYPDDEFYKQCDEKGLLVWQDMMYACAMYPADSAFIKSARLEAIAQVLRLRNHACIALWCGDNEISEGWYNWGWQKQYKYSAKDSAIIWKNYKKLNGQVRDAMLGTETLNAKFWPSSPLYGWGRKESLLKGDCHYWGVWWGNEPFDMYKQKVGRFMSEYGFQSLPALSTFKLFCDAPQLNLNSAAVKNHQKHPKGFETIDTYMQRDYKIHPAFGQYIYTSQLLQRDGMKTAIEAHRRAKPYCMGTLFWQLNDCWPGTTWSAIDYYKTPKALYYETKKLYKNILPSVVEKDSLYEFYVVSDSLKSFGAELLIHVKDFSGKVLLEKTTKFYVKANSSALCFTLEKQLLKNTDLQRSYLSFEVRTNHSRTLAKTLFYFVKPKELNLPESDYSYAITGNRLTLKVKKLVKDLYISIDDGAAVLSENFFDLEAGEEKTITIDSPKFDPATLKFYCLNQQ